MKNAPFYLSIAIVALGIAAFALLDYSESPAVQNHQKPSCKIMASIYPTQPGYRITEESVKDYKRLYIVRKRFSKRITKAQIQEAKLINDFLPHYPGGWIVEYTSVKIIAEIKGETKTATAPDNKLTAEQVALLNTLEPLDGIFLQIRYMAENSVTGEMESSMMEYALGVIPDVEAEFRGGHDALINYLAENSWEEIVANGYDALSMKTTGIRFTINLEGKAEDIEVFVPSGNKKVDEILKQTIENMPPWIPAENFNGEKAKEQFELVMGDGC